ncbi:MAG: RNA-binding domain-containing protein [Candidatus Sulfotelmatobacter sp.]
MDLQELITRARFLFSGAPERLALFKLVNGREDAQQLAAKTRRHVNNVRRDLNKLRDAGLIEEGPDSREKRGNGMPAYAKVPLARTVPIRYFLRPTGKPQPKPAKARHVPRAADRRKPLAVPTGEEILDICKDGEDQTYEFKAAGTEARKIAREICAMLNTKRGGIILYGVDDSGKIIGSDVPRQKFDQALQNSIKNSISPAANITLKSVRTMGMEVLVIIVPPWNRRDVFQFDEKVLLRKGTNVFGAKPEELKKLHQRTDVI